MAMTGVFIDTIVVNTLTTLLIVVTGVWKLTPVMGGELTSTALTASADLMIIAPATADILAKMASGIADDLVSTLALSAHGACPILIAPAMNTRMWLAPPTQDNIARLKKWSVHVTGPDEGRLACNTTGPGRMSEPEEILAAATQILQAGKTGEAT